jgi:hypothetical protein
MIAGEKKLLAELAAVKKELAGLGEIRPGALVEQWNTCGSKQCACKDPEAPRKHGPYWLLAYRFQGKSTSEFVREEDLETVRRQIAEYRRARELKDEWIRISIALAKLRREARQAAKK